MSFIAGYLLGLEEGGGSNIQPLTVTENKEYNAADYGCDGFQPVLVNVPAAVKSITITRNGTYTPPAGYDGYNPVIVKNPYETLYILEHGGGDDIDTNITDSDGNEIVINGNEIDDTNDLNDLISAAINADDSVTVGVSDGNNIFSMKIEMIYSIINGVEFVDPQLTLTNLKTGATLTTPNRYPFYNQKSEGATFVCESVFVRPTYAGVSIRYYYNGVMGISPQLSPTLSNIGITNFSTTNDKYYVLGGV